MMARIGIVAVGVLLSSIAVGQEGRPKTVEEAEAVIDREQVNVERLEKLTASGAVSLAELNQGRQALAAARLVRAEIEKNSEEIIAQLKVLIELRQAIYDTTAQLFERGVTSSADRDEALRLVHDTRARLAMEQKDTQAAIEHLTKVVELDRSAVERMQRLTERGAATEVERQTILNRSAAAQKVLDSLKQQAGAQQ